MTAKIWTVRNWFVKGLFLALAVWFLVGGVGLLGEARLEHRRRIAGREAKKEEFAECTDPAQQDELSSALGAGNAFEAAKALEALTRSDG